MKRVTNGPGKSADVVRKEIYTHWLGYNLIRVPMWRFQPASNSCISQPKKFDKPVESIKIWCFVLQEEYVDEKLHGKKRAG
jgi:hypothetical protein